MSSPYLDFERAAWARLRAATPLTLTESDLAELQGINERVSLAEVEAIYLPLSRLLNLQVAATQTLHKATDTFLGSLPAPTPYVIGIAGSVAVGKSTFARILRTLLARWPDHPRVDLVTTDGFLLPNRELEQRGLMTRKGFPESYDLRRLIDFMAAIKAAEGAVHAPVYSHQAYDIVPGEFQVVDRPDIVIVEGLTVLQRGDAPVFVSDYFDFSIYLDASEHDVEQWYIDRFFALRETVFRDPRSYFHRFASLSDDEAVATAREIWTSINGVNLRENIRPTRERARVILEKSADHSVQRVRLRKM
ncbi:MAG TPA: type I pantothenate kinase [Vicinamibacterales bacterium]|jgi:type I pantothenate kinase|nr:type I pantothenate kinase [Vicinamibacterales bacterium]